MKHGKLWKQSLCELSLSQLWNKRPLHLRGILWEWNYGSDKKEYSGGRKKKDWRLFYSWLHQPNIISYSPSVAPPPTRHFRVEVPHKDPFCPRHHRSHIFSALILHEHLRRENTNQGKTRLGHWKSWRMMRSLKKKPAFPDQGVGPCDARSQRVFVSLHVWHRGCERLNEVCLYSSNWRIVTSRDLELTKWLTMLFILEGNNKEMPLKFLFTQKKSHGQMGATLLITAILMSFPPYLLKASES